MKTWIKVLSVLIFASVLVSFLVFYFLYNKPHPNYETMNADYTVSAADLYKSFTANKAEAGTMYNGKVIAITGKLSKVEVADSLTICVFVFNKGMFGDEGLRCTMLPNYCGQVKKIPPDTEVRLKGYCTGFNDTDVILDKCSIVKQ
ncbi:MAG: hypothetical protein NTY96_02930 [Bacteroidetes bacterium]|nr:hypothetical protein [Bacteroidota bacterium]